MRILLTNDDGVHARGLEVLEEIARALSDDIWVVAPETDQSGVSHSLSLNDPLRLREIGPRHFAVKGTPTDCVIMAARHIIPQGRPDLLLSGVNRGRNAAEDVTYSGTVAGAIEGAALGVRAEIRSRPHPPRTRRRHAARRPRQYQFPGLCAGPGQGHRGQHPGQASPGAAAHRAASRRPRQSLLLDRLRA